MRHLLLCREFPPAAYPPGGIGTYADTISRLLAAAGETVHVIAHRWSGAPASRETLSDGRLIIHRVSLDDDVADAEIDDLSYSQRIRVGLLASSCPAQTFSWQAAILIERLIEDEAIDVIEAQEWEAPLYYFLLRRDLGISRQHRRPPCVIYLHSPTARIYEANGWDRDVADYAPTVALEAFTIRHADAILAPSRFMADQAIADYGLARDRVHVIPNPIGEAATIERSGHTWRSGSICHIGRLEGRKGINEWADAVAMVNDPSQTFELVGSDTPVRVTGGPGVGEMLRQRLDRGVLRQFSLHGGRDHAGVQEVLGRSWASVVPSRWENFPYSCIEAMASGLPVIASPNGGMRELIEDGVSGWIAESATPPGLADALRRALNTPPAERATMGAQAARRVRAVCGNHEVVGQHLVLKSRLAAAPSAIEITPVSSSVPASRIAVVVVDRGAGNVLACLESLGRQTVAPAEARLIAAAVAPETHALCESRQWTVVEVAGTSSANKDSEIASALLRSPGALTAIVFVDARAQMAADFLAICASVFHQCPSLGLLTGWTTEAGSARVHVPANPARPHLSDDDQLSSCFAVGVAAIEKAAAARSAASESPMPLLSQVASDAGALVYPAVVCEIEARERSEPKRRFSAMARGLQRQHMPLLRWFFDGTPEDRRGLLVQVFRSPSQSAQQLVAPLTRLFKAGSNRRRSRVR